MPPQPFWSAPVLLGLFLLAGCAPQVSQMLTSPEDMRARRQLQTRQYASGNEERVLIAATALLQDMGFQIEEGNSHLGMVLGSKMRDANSLTPEQRALAAVAFVGLLAGVYTAPLAPLLLEKIQDKPVRIEAAIITRKVGAEGSRVEVRIIIRETGFKDGRPGPPAVIRDAPIYHEVFDRLSKALFLEARES